MASTGGSNFHGIETEIDATFSAAIQTFDKSLRAVSMGLKTVILSSGHY